MVIGWPRNKRRTHTLFLSFTTSTGRDSETQFVKLPLPNTNFLVIWHNKFHSCHNSQQLILKTLLLQNTQHLRILRLRILWGESASMNNDQRYCNCITVLLVCRVFNFQCRLLVISCCISRLLNSIQLISCLLVSCSSDLCMLSVHTVKVLQFDCIVHCLH